MSIRGSSRGASIVGVLALLAILSATAVTLEMQSLALNSSAQLAATTCSTIDGSKICDGKDSTTVGSDAYKKLTCQVGLDFILRMNPDGSAPVIYYSNTSGKVTTQSSSNQCQTVSAEKYIGPTTDPVTKQQIPRRQCYPTGSQAWKCYIKVCFRASSAKAISSETITDDMPCQWRLDKPIDVGKTLTDVTDTVAQKAQGSTVTDLLRQSKTGTAEEQAQATAQLQALNSTTQDGLVSAFNDEVKIQTATVEQAQQAAKDASLALQSCQDQKSPINSTVFCQDELNAMVATEKKLDEEQLKLTEMQKYAQELKDQKYVLSSTIPGDGGTGGQQAPANIDPCSGYTNGYDQFLCRQRGNGGIGSGGSTFGGTGPGQYMTVGTGYGASPGGQYNRAQLEDMCRRGDTRSCQILAGVASPTSQQQCATTGSGGWTNILFSALSIFTGNRSIGQQNCIPGSNTGTNGNGVPTPTCSITASPTNISAPGQQVTLTWQSQNAFSGNLSNLGTVAPQGSTTVSPQTTTTYTLSIGGYIDNSNGRQLGGQCSTRVTVGGSGSGSTTPQAQIACSPLTADVGMSVAISYACANSNTSVGSGFSTNGQLSGSATPIVTASTLGSDNKVTYGITCSREGQTDTAQCTVAVNNTSIVLVANPKDIASGGDSNIGWVTTGMEACTISSPTLAGFTSANVNNNATSGVAKTPPLSSDTTFVLTCTTKSGVTKTAEVGVKVR